MKSFKHHNARTLKTSRGSAVEIRRESQSQCRRDGSPRRPARQLRGRLSRSGDQYQKHSRPRITSRPAAKGLRIGALTTLADIVKSPAVRKDYSLLAEAAHSVASPNLRNMATVGGNLAQDVRCWYYRYPQQIGGPIVCLRKGGKDLQRAGGRQPLSLHFRRCRGRRTPLRGTLPGAHQYPRVSCATSGKATWPKRPGF